MPTLLPLLRLLVSAACLLVASSVRAQTPPLEQPKPASLRFLFLDETAGAYSLKTGQQFRQLGSAPYVISPPYTPPDLGRIELYKNGPTIDPATGEYPRVPVAGFTPPANTNAALVIVTPRPAAPGERPAYHVEFIDSSPSSFPAGSLRVLNRGQAAMAARFSQGQVTAEPGSTQIIPATGDHRGRLRVLVAVQNGSGWKLIDDNLVIIKPDTRVTGVLVYSPSGMRFRFHEAFIAERGEPPPSHVWLTYTDTP